MTYRELASHLASRSEPSKELTSISVLVDASLGGIHSALWLPVAHALAQSGVAVGLTSAYNRLPPDVDELEELQEKYWFKFIAMPVYGISGLDQQIPCMKAYFARLPWKGTFGLATVLMQRWTDRMIYAWHSILSTSPVKVFVTTEPYTCPTNALMYAAHDLGIKTVYIQQGLPGGSGVWRAPPVCDIAIVWTQVGATLLRENGWLDTSILIAKHPALPDAHTLLGLRNKRRLELGVRESDFCVLFLGQIACERNMFPIPGYLETCVMLGMGLKSAMQSTNLIPVLRPHGIDTKRETERILRGTGLPMLTVSQRAALWDDLAAADVVISNHSTALEEAYLIGRPTLQIASEGFPLEVDFSILGTPITRTPEELAGFLTSRRWITASRPTIPACRSVAEEISDLVKT